MNARRKKRKKWYFASTVKSARLRSEEAKSILGGDFLPLHTVTGWLGRRTRKRKENRKKRDAEA
jgi:hypothetical protein